MRNKPKEYLNRLHSPFKHISLSDYLKILLKYFNPHFKKLTQNLPLMIISKQHCYQKYCG